MDKVLRFVATFILALGCFVLDMHNNSLARLGLYAFFNPVLLCVICSLLVSLLIFKVQPFAIAAVLILCLLANKSLGPGINQDVIFTALIVLLLLPSAQRWIDH